MAVKRQMVNGDLALEDLPFQAMFGVIGSWIGLILILVCFMATIFNAFPAVGEPFSAVSFIQDMLQIPIVILLFVGYKICKKTKFVRLTEADLVGGRRETDLHSEKMRDIAERAEWGPFRRVWRFFC